MSVTNGIKENFAYKATVVDNNDPRKLGRIKVRVPLLFDSIPNEHLPWCRPKTSSAEGAGAGFGSVRVPRVGTSILIKFPGKNILSPEYDGCYIDDTTHIPEGDVNYPNRIVEYFSNGTMFIVDTVANEVYFRAVNDCKLYVTGNVNLTVDGNVTQVIKGNRHTVVEGNDTLVVNGIRSEFAQTIYNIAGGNAVFRASGTNYLYGSELRWNSSSTPNVPTPANPVPEPWPGVRTPTP